MPFFLRTSIARLPTGRTNIIRALDSEGTAVKDKVSADIAFIALLLPTAGTTPVRSGIPSIVCGYFFRQTLQFRLPRMFLCFLFQPEDSLPSSPSLNRCKHYLSSRDDRFLSALHPFPSLYALFSCLAYLLSFASANPLVCTR